MVQLGILGYKCTGRFYGQGSVVVVLGHLAWASGDAKVWRKPLLSGASKPKELPCALLYSVEIGKILLYVYTCTVSTIDTLGYLI